MKYDYGDDVLVMARNSDGNSLNRTGTVVGILSVENAEQARIFEYPIRTVLYTIEFSDGSDALLPEEHLKDVVRQPLPLVAAQLE